ncbi:hypothetical protein RIF29_40586 [Crotalaria pallida]|uniref:Uncharacterized protein n=1 Tax=Crotalaria pallida TaxID=3830 RepID=A0AAN9E9P8_CROPI
MEREHAIRVAVALAVTNQNRRHHQHRRPIPIQNQAPPPPAASRRALAATAAACSPPSLASSRSGLGYQVTIEHRWITFLVEIYDPQAKGPPVEKYHKDHLKRSHVLLTSYKLAIIAYSEVKMDPLKGNLSTYSD